MEATRAERTRVRELQAGAQRFDLPADMLAAAIEDGTSVAAFQRQVLEHIGSDTSTVTGQRMFSPAIRRGGKREYSLTRAIAAEYSGNWSEAGFEREVAQETTRAVGKSASGFYVPPAVLGRAVITTATAPTLIGTDHMASSLHRRAAAVWSAGDEPRGHGSAGAGGECGDSFVMVSGTGAEWIAEGSASTESSPVFDSVPLSLKQLSARSQLSRRQMKQSLPGLDASEERSAPVHRYRTGPGVLPGAGGATVPRGVLNTVGALDR